VTSNAADPPLDALVEDARGDLLRPGEDGYEEARTVWNALIDREPAAILRCTGTADVITGVDFAREHDLLLSVKGGGHHVSGSAVCDGGLTLDLGPMDWVHVDPETKTARVGAGATWGDVDHETQAFGLAVPGGQDPNIGVAGLTLGGGVGWLSRKHGLTCDNLLGADIVTADGELVHASETDNPDLFWALRGGGGNFGVVTAFEYELHEVGPEIFAGSLIYPATETAAVARRYRAFVADAPREVRLLFGSMHLPDSDVYPESVRDSRAAMLIASYAGPPSEGRDVLEPLREAGDPEPVMDSLRPRRYADFQRAGTSQGSIRTDLRTQFFETLSDSIVDTLVEYVADPPSAGATVFVSPRSGAETDPRADATAYPHRTDAHRMLIEARWSDPDDDDVHREWVRDFHEAVRPATTGEAAMNFLTVDEGDRIPAAYGDNYERLAEIKAEWDPDNFFRTNQNVEPSG
jgi:FAD/FMN-containing dehydrogenase